MSTTKKAYLLRLTEDLYTELETWAAQDYRSVNAQIEYLLQRLVEQRAAIREPELPLPTETPADYGPSSGKASPPEELDLTVD